MRKVSFKVKKYRKAKYYKKTRFEGINIIFFNTINKTILIILLFSAYLIYIIHRKKPKNPNQIFSIENKENFINISSSPLNEHYKLLLPKYKYHPLKKIKPEERYNNLFKLEDSIDYKKMKETGKDKYIYDICAVIKAKYENLYARQFIEYYLKLGVEKFYFGDDNPENIENLSDVLDDYIKKGIVDIEYIFYRNLTHMEFFEYSFRNLKLRCNWFLLIDVDEYLEFTDKNMTIKSYLEMPVFNKCDVIKIHWLQYDDNNLVYYDDRPLMERMNHSVYSNYYSKFHKSIVRGKDYKDILFDSSNHQPNLTNVYDQCDAYGNFERYKPGILGSPKYKYGYFRHFSYKTAEEFSIKMIRGRHKGIKFNYDEFVDYFFKVNQFTEEKLQVIENILNRTFPKYHKNK